MATLAAIWFVSGSMRNRAGALSHGTQTAVASTASLLVLQSSGMVAETSFVFGSILVRIGLAVLVTQTDPAPAAMPFSVDKDSNGMVALTWSVCGSMRVMVPLAEAQTAP